MCDIDIITTTYRNKDKLKICLSSVVENTKYVDYKWYLMANEPDDEVKQIIYDSIFVDGIRFSDRIEPIFNDNNNGSFSSNNNEIVKEGNGGYILFLNDDIQPTHDSWLLNMKSILDNDQSVGCVGALLLYPDGKIQHTGVIFDERTNGLPYHMLYKQPLSDFVYFNRVYQAVTAACMLVRRNDFERLGGFDQKFIYGYEDTDFCLRMKSELDKKSVCCNSSRLIHHEGVSGKFKKHPHLENNIKIFREKWGGKIYNDHQFYLNNQNFMVYG